MKTVLIILALAALFSMACAIGNGADTGNNNNPGNLNTPSSSNPSQGINTAAAPTAFAPAVGTPLGDGAGLGTPTVPSLNQAPQPVFSPTANLTPAPSVTP